MEDNGLARPSRLLWHGGLEINSLTLTHDPQRDSLAGLIRAQDARGMRPARRLATIDGQNHVAVLQLQGSIRRRANDQHALFSSEIRPQVGG